MKVINKIQLTLLVISILSLISCKKETIEIQKTVTIYSTTDSTIILDKIIGTPYEWGPVFNSQIKKLVDISPLCNFCDDAVLDVYWGSGGTNWLRLPFVDNLNKVAVNYNWSNHGLVVFAYGDSTILANKSYWDGLRKNTLKIKATIKK